MSYNNSIIYAPDSIYDVQQAVNSRNSDLGYLITNGNINKWAKFKPFRSPHTDIVPVVDNAGFPVRQTAVGTHYRYLVEANCGLYVNYRNQGRNACISKTIAMMAAGNDDDVWQYLRPSGGASQPFRLVDFVGYNKNAHPFLWQNNLSEKIITYRGSESAGMDVDFFIDCFDSNNESVDGMIEAGDLCDGIYNSDNLHYACIIASPYIMSEVLDTYVVAMSIASAPISSVNGRTAAFSVTRQQGGNLSIQGNISSGVTFASMFKVFHMLTRYDNDNYTYLPLPYCADYPAITNLTVQTSSTSVQFLIQAVADFVSAGQAIAGLTFQDINGDIAIHAWTGLTVRLDLINSSAQAVTVNFGRVYCLTNCTDAPVAATAVYNSNYQLISNQVTVPPQSGDTPGRTSIYMTFANTFSIGTLDGADVEISFWGVDENDDPTINQQSFGNDGTIIYHTT